MTASPAATVAQPGTSTEPEGARPRHHRFRRELWAWALLSPLGPVYLERGLTADASLIVAIPVLVGSLGRIAMGGLTDRFGGHLMFPLVSLITVIPVLFLGFVGQYTYPTLLVGGFFLGIAGTTFAIGVPYVNSWFPPAKRGMATGLYGVGMGGTAISAFTTVPLLNSIGDAAPSCSTALALTVYAIVGWLFMRNAPTWEPRARTSSPSRRR